MKLSTEPNYRRRQLIERAGAVLPPCVGAVLMLVIFVGMQGHAAAPTLMGTVFLMTLITWLITAMNTAASPVTAKAVGGTETHIAIMCETLTRIAGEGMSPRDRPSVQRAIDQGAASLRQVLGEAPWIAAERADWEDWIRHDIPTGPDIHPQQTATTMNVKCSSLPELGHVRHGMDMAKARARVANMLPALVSIARAFDLDTSGLEPVHVRLRGMVDRSAQPLEAAATRVHALASRWQETDRGDIDPLLRIEADAAAGRDLRDLEQVWMQARQLADPERQPEIDESYRRATDALAITLERALDSVARTSVDALTTQVGYIEAKHSAGVLTA